MAGEQKVPEWWQPRCGKCIHIGTPFTMRCREADEWNSPCEDYDSKAGFVSEGMEVKGCAKPWKT